MGNSCAVGLELQLLVLLALSASYALNDSFELFIVQIDGRGVDRQAIFIVLLITIIITFIVHVVLIIIIFNHQLSRSSPVLTFSFTVYIIVVLHRSRRDLAIISVSGALLQSLLLVQ